MKTKTNICHYGPKDQDITTIFYKKICHNYCTVTENICILDIQIHKEEDFFPSPPYT